MIELVVFIFGFPDTRSWAEIEDVFLRAGREDLAARGPEPTGVYAVRAAVDSPEAERLRTALAEAGFRWSERREDAYSPSDLRDAPLLSLAIVTTPKGIRSPFDTRYDFSTACGQCGTGARQVSSLVLKPEDLPLKGKIRETLTGEVIVSPQLAKALRQARLRGFMLHEVYAASRPLPWSQVLAERTLPPMHRSTTGLIREGPCPGCRRDGYFGDTQNPMRITYARDAIEPYDSLDAVATWECFGNSNRLLGRLAQPLLLFKPRILDVFRRAGVRGVEFKPASFVD